MRIIVTGAAGFGGSGLIKRLLAENHSVTAVDITGPYQSSNLSDLQFHEKLNYYWMSIHDITCDIISGHEVLIHLAAEANVPMGFTSPRWTTYQNVDGTVSLLESCRDANLKKVIYAGSGNEWGRPQYLPIDENHPLTPHNPYAFSKAAAELAFWAWHRAYNIPVVVMSNGVVSGPGMRKDIFIYRWLKNIIINQPIILEGGEQTRDVTYVDDVVDAWIKVVDAPEQSVVGEKFQVSYGTELTLFDILELCFKVTGKRVNVIKNDYRPGEKGQREQFTNEKARRVLGYKPRITPAENIKRTYEWMTNSDQSEL